MQLSDKHPEKEEEDKIKQAIEEVKSQLDSSLYDMKVTLFKS